MKYSYSYLDERFTNALRSLSTSSKSLQERLHLVSIDLVAVRPQHFEDPEMCSVFEDIDARITRIKDDRLGSIPATLAKMTNDEAEAMAKDIFSLAMAVRGKVQDEEISAAKNANKVANNEHP
jgi:hypothetical protein